MRVRLVLLFCALPALGCGEAPAGAAAPPSVKAAEETPRAVVAPASVATVATIAPTAPAAPVSILISAVGDCTLGGDVTAGDAPGGFADELNKRGNDPRYPFSGVLSVLSQDDLTIANLETTLSTAPGPSPPDRLRFRGKPEHVAVLKEGSVEIVNFANNHSYDLGKRGYDETIKHVRAAGIGISGNELVDRRMVKGVEVVNAGFTGGDITVLPAVKARVAKLKTEKNLLIVSFHWGNEGSNEINDNQRKLGRAAIDAGADLVLGSHPHVLQGIEEYQGRQIVYSLANFVFGGHSNPKDKDSIIYQATFTERGGRMVPAGSAIVPVRVSSETTRNDYRPVLLEGDDRARVLGRMKRFSELLEPKARAAR